jgi:pectin methylesterase-like acyl-CoA thioesterase
LAVVATALISIALSGVGQRAAYADPAFSATFADGSTAGWVRSGGDWSVATDGSQVLKQASTSANAHFFAGSKAWTGYQVRARVKTLPSAPGGIVALLARATSTATFARMVLTPTAVRLESVRAGAVTVLGSAPTQITPGTWYTVAVSVSGNAIRGSVNGQPVVSGTLPAVGVGGQIGLQTVQATAEFDDVLVTLSSPAPPTPTVTVAADGTGDFTTVQAAVDSVPVNNAQRFTIGIEPGDYHEVVTVPSNKPLVSFLGLGAQPSDVEIEFDNANGTMKPDGTTFGTSGSASVLLSGNDFTAGNITFANTFNEAAHPEITGQQAVAVRTTGDRLVFENVRFLGNQDTLYDNSVATTTVDRSYYRDCYVEGDVDFIFGRGTAVFDNCEIHSLDRGSTSNNGYVTAASTDTSNPFGFLFEQCALTSAAAPGTVSLGRPWHPGNDVNAIAQVVVRDSVIGAHLKSPPWTDFGTFSWRDARYDEYLNTGPGSTPTADRPQLTDAQAPSFTPQAYLAGADGWNPVSGPSGPGAG